MDAYGNVTSLSEAQFLSYHTQVAVKDMCGNIVYVDEGLSVLLPILWDLGFETKYSCSGGTTKSLEAGDYVYKDGYIYFATVTMAESFAEIASVEVPSKINENCSQMDSMIIRFPECRISSFIERFQSVTLHHPALRKIYELSQIVNKMEGS